MPFFSVPGTRFRIYYDPVVTPDSLICRTRSVLLPPSLPAGGVVLRMAASAAALSAVYNSAATAWPQASRDALAQWRPARDVSAAAGLAKCGLPCDNGDPRWAVTGGYFLNAFGITKYDCKCVRDPHFPHWGLLPLPPLPSRAAATQRSASCRVPPVAPFNAAQRVSAGGWWPLLAPLGRPSSSLTQPRPCARLSPRAGAAFSTERCVSGAPARGASRSESPLCGGSL